MSIKLVHRQREPRPQPTSMLHFKSCCCRFSLKHGSIAIGIVTAAATLTSLSLALSWAKGAFGRTWAEGQQWAQRARDMGIDHDYIDATLHDGFSRMRFASDDAGQTLLHLIGLVEAFHFNFSLMLLYGIWKERPPLLMTWVRVSVAAMALRILLFLPLVVQALAADFISLGVTALVLTVVAVVPATYFILVVYNYHWELSAELPLRAYERAWTALR